MRSSRGSPARKNQGALQGAGPHRHPPWLGEVALCERALSSRTPADPSADPSLNCTSTENSRSRAAPPRAPRELVATERCHRCDDRHGPTVLPRIGVLRHQTARSILAGPVERRPARHGGGTCFAFWRRPPSPLPPERPGQRAGNGPGTRSRRAVGPTGGAPPPESNSMRGSRSARRARATAHCSSSPGRCSRGGRTGAPCMAARSASSTGSRARAASSG